MVFTFSCSSDGRGNNIGDFETVVIGTQTWMAKNLNYAVEGSKCYGNDPANCVKYGRLYEWQTAKTVCPSGWHLPSDTEWDELENSTDAHGFLATLGGVGNPDSSFNGAGDLGYWWGASEHERNTGAYGRGIYRNGRYVNWGIIDKFLLFSVRCVGD